MERAAAGAHRELVVQASAKNVNRLRAVLGQLAQCAADNFADKQAAYYAHHCYAALLACKANQPTGKQCALIRELSKLSNCIFMV